MKHQDYIDKFVEIADEFDGYCFIFWLPSSKYNMVLPEPRTDILGAWLDEETKALEFLTMSPDDRDQQMVHFGELPYSIQKELVAEFKTYSPLYRN